MPPLDAAHRTEDPVVTDAAPRFPPQIRYIIGNEAAERFSFYGMRNILTVFLVDYLLTRHAGNRGDQAQAVFHTFVMGVYLFPLLGGLIADWWWGKYRTVLWLSLLYVAGHACLALFEDSERGFYTGLFLIALGSGGIKPCVSAFVGDQFTVSNRSLVPKVFGWFYWSVNLGSFFASATMPKVLEHLGPRVAFAIPGVLMAVATLIFWAGRKLYVRVPPHEPDRHAFVFVLLSGLLGKAEGGFWQRARARHPPEAVDGARAVLGVASIFAPIPLFWACFDQKASLWVLQARNLDLRVGSLTLAPSQLQAVNPLLVLLLVPLVTYGLYPWLERRGIRFTPLRRIVSGLVLTATSFLGVALIQNALESGARPSVLWQVGPYVVLTVSEILVSITGLEFAYTQAPIRMKGSIMSLWLLTTFAGNFVVVLVKKFGLVHGTTEFLFWAGLTYLAALCFWLIARGYAVRDQLLPDVPGASSAAGAAAGLA
jgi:proton-dependent oligopeptide transporter, POT family